MDKNLAMIEFLNTCPYIKDDTLFFNFGNVEEGAHQLVVNSDDVSLQRPYIDGSVLKRYTFSIDSFKSAAYNPVLNGYSDENVDDFKAIQDLLDWVEDQNDAQNFPNFGEDCIIDEMLPLTSKPVLLVADTSVTPPMAIYRISIRIIYLDTSKQITKEHSYSSI